MTPDLFSDHNAGPPEPVIIDGEEEYKVETILDCRRKRNQLQYLIKWKGYAAEENYWEQDSCINAQDLIQALFHRHLEKLAQLGIQGLPIGKGALLGKVHSCAKKIGPWLIRRCEMGVCARANAKQAI